MFKMFFSPSRVSTKHTGQAMIEYFVGLVVVSVLIASLFIILLPEALADAFNTTFDRVYNEMLVEP